MTGHAWRWERPIAFPRHSRPVGGVDHGSIGRCLIEIRDMQGKPLRRLVWFPGFMTAAAGIRGYGRRYVPSQLADMPADQILGTTIHGDGGRLARPLLDRLADAIDARYGAGATAAIRPGSTLVIEAGAKAD